MADESTSYDDVLSRRRFVELAGVTGAAALAGCDGSTNPDDDGNGTDGDDSMDGPADVVHEGVTTADPTKVQYNPFNSSNESTVTRRLLFERFATYHFIEGEFSSAAVEEWNFTGDTFEMQMREDLTWSDGSDVTADDIVTQLKIAEYDEDPMWEWAGGVSKDGDYTVVVDVAEDVNPALVENDVLNRWVAAADANYGERLSALENGDSEIADVRSFADTEPLTNGPFTIDARDDQVMMTARHDGYPNADAINYQNYAFNTMGGNQARQQALLNLEVDSDFSLTVPSNVVADFPDPVEEVTIPDVFGVGLAPNFNHKHAGDRAVRQAIAYVMNRQRAVDNSLPRVKQAPEVMTGISTDYQEDWLGDAMGDYDTYGKDSSMTEEATAVLEDAGYSKSNGTWQDSDGDTVSVPITSPNGWSDWTLALESVIQDLNDFGFDASLEGTGDYFGAITSDDYVFMANTWLHGGPTPYPYYSLLHQLREPQLHNCKTNYPAYTEQYGGSNETTRTVPSRSGDGTTDVDVQAKLNSLSTATEDSNIQSLVRELAWVSNQDLPRIPLLEKNLQMWLTDDEWDIPDNLQEDPDANTSYAPTELPRHGKLQYSGN